MPLAVPREVVTRVVRPLDLKIAVLTLRCCLGTFNPFSRACLVDACDACCIVYDTSSPPPPPPHTHPQPYHHPHWYGSWAFSSPSRESAPNVHSTSAVEPTRTHTSTVEPTRTHTFTVEPTRTHLSAVEPTRPLWNPHDP